MLCLADTLRSKRKEVDVLDLSSKNCPAADATVSLFLAF